MNLGIDIGGANLKLAAADLQGKLLWVRQIPCPLWQGMEYLHSAYREALDDCAASEFDSVRITMTGEMVDLFSCRAEGVAALIADSEGRFAKQAANDSLYFWCLDGFRTAKNSIATEQVAAMNWLATAQLIASQAATTRSILVIDSGTTTTDLVPIENGTVIAQGYDDHRRLQLGELIYSASERTPLMAVAASVQFGGTPTPVIAEYFATIGDVHRILGNLPTTYSRQVPIKNDTADGRSQSLNDCRARLARMIRLDASHYPLASWQALASEFAQQQFSLIETAATRIVNRSFAKNHAGSKIVGDRLLIVGAGGGRFLARQLAQKWQSDYLEFHQFCGNGIDGALAEQSTAAAPATALALLPIKTRR